MIEHQESSEDASRAFMCVRATRIFRKVFTQRHLPVETVVNGNVDGEKNEWHFHLTSWSLALNSFIPVKNIIIDVFLNQDELTTSSKRAKHSSNRVWYKPWSRALSLWEARRKADAHTRLSEKQVPLAGSS